MGGSVETHHRKTSALSPLHGSRRDRPETRKSSDFYGRTDSFRKRLNGLFYDVT